MFDTIFYFFCSEILKKGCDFIPEYCFSSMQWLSHEFFAYLFYNQINGDCEAQVTAKLRISKKNPCFQGVVYNYLWHLFYQHVSKEVIWPSSAALPCPVLTSHRQRSHQEVKRMHKSAALWWSCFHWGSIGRAGTGHFHTSTVSDRKTKHKTSSLKSLALLDFSI